MPPADVAEAVGFGGKCLPARWQVAVLGIVTSFDDPRGLGTIEADGAEYPFHCTALLDGTRTIEVGTAVAFEVRPAGMGRWEATEIAARSASL